MTNTVTIDLKSLIREVPDFPKPGINFKDITTLLQDKEGLRYTLEELAKPYLNQQIDLVVGIESRGFLFGMPLAQMLGAGFVPIRKPGKLPSETVEQEYALEYGTDKVAIHKDAINPGQNIVLVDDLLATGGTMGAAIQLVEKLQANVLGISVVIELAFLNGKAKLGSYPTHHLISY